MVLTTVTIILHSALNLMLLYTTEEPEILTVYKRAMLKKLFARIWPYVRKVPESRLFGVEGLPTGGGNWKWSFGPWEVTTVGDRFSVRTEISHVCLKKSLGEAEAHILNELLRHANAIGYGIVSK